MNITAEEWRPVPMAGFSDIYQVSDLGRVRSLDRMVWTKGHRSLRLQQGRLLTPTPNTNGYLRVRLRNGEAHITPDVHRLVLGAFVGPCPPGQVARHGPGGQQDNRLVNLCYGTPAENNGADKYRDGTILLGEACHSAKLTGEIVRLCRMRYAAGGVSTVSLAAEYGVCQAAMWNAVTGKTWRHVQ